MVFITMDKILEEIIEVIKVAGNKILSAKNELIEAIYKEGRGNIVTKYDKEIELYLRDELKKIIPNSSFIGEEGDIIDNDNEYKFIVDPIDGTYNFYEDLNLSCISIALLKNNKPYIGVCFNPYVNELFYATKGNGAYLNNKRIYVSNKLLKDGIFFSGSASYYNELKEETIINHSKLFKVANDYRRLGSCVIEMCHLAAGRAELFIEARLQLWDYAAVSLIIEEAGGKISTIDGQELKYDGACSIIASNNKEDYLKYLK